MASETPSWNSNRTETALQSLVEGAAEEGVDAVTDRHVTVRVTNPGNENCQHALFTAVNLLARLHPVIGEVVIALARDVEFNVYIPGITAESVGEAVEELSVLID